MRLAYVGNFQPDLPAGVRAWSTETHWSEGFELAGLDVVRVQEREGVWSDMPDHAAEHGADFVFWTRTWGLDRDLAGQAAGVAACRRMGLPVAAGHLDKFFGLPREHQVADEPWFHVDVVFTADGGNQDRFEAAGVRHVWLPPAVHEPECEPGRWRAEMASDVAFVGSWRGGYHPEWTHRAELVERLRRYYGPIVKFWPERPGVQVRGRDLADLYASASVLVGDSCMVDGRGRYWSDRVPETLGRGGLLVHPDTDWGGQYEPGSHLLTWPLGDWRSMKATVDLLLSDPPAARAMAQRGRAHVLAHHTYTQRAHEVIAELRRRELIG